VVGLDRSAVDSDKLTLQAYVHDVHVDIYSVLKVLVVSSADLVGALSGSAVVETSRRFAHWSIATLRQQRRVLLSIIHLHLSLVTVPLDMALLLHFLLSSAAVHVDGTVGSDALAVHCVVQVVLALDHVRAHHAVQVLLLVLVHHSRVDTIEGVLQFLSAHLLLRRQNMRAVRTSSRGSLLHTHLLLLFLRDLVGSYNLARLTFLPLGIGRAGPDKVVIPKIHSVLSALAVSSLLAFEVTRCASVVVALALVVFTHRRVALLLAILRLVLGLQRSNVSLIVRMLDLLLLHHRLRSINIHRKSNWVCLGLS